jgi:ribosomal protein L11 methyltransferase
LGEKSRIYEMSWIQLTLLTNSQHSETLSKYLTQQGAVSVTFMPGDHTPDIIEPLPGKNPLWDTLQLTALFDDNTPHLAPLVETLRSQYPSLTLTPLEDKDWVREWMQYFQPLQFGNRLWICPTHALPPDPTAPTLFLDPGLAFGTGTHPTTALCLEWLAKHCGPTDVVLDYGCGSGILSLAAHKLGARRVVGVDYDVQALQATRDNARLNSISNLESYLPKDCPDFQATLVIANIISGPLIALAPTLQGHLAPSGTLILSGLLISQVPLVQNAYPSIHFDPPTVQDDWVRLVGQKETSFT